MQISDLLELFKKIFVKAFDYKKALKRLNYGNEDIEALRDKLMESKFVPKFIVNPQVDRNKLKCCAEISC